MRLKINGYILLFTQADHEGRHIHVFKDNRELGVFDRIDGPIRGLDAHFGKNLRGALEQFIDLLNERGPCKMVNSGKQLIPCETKISAYTGETPMPPWPLRLTPFPHTSGFLNL